MLYGNRWETIEEMGSGGQGRVYTVYDRSRFDTAKLGSDLRDAVGSLSFATYQEYGGRLEQFRKVVRAVVAMDDPGNWGALKALHRPEDARDPERAEERIRREIKAMSEDVHPNLVRLLDFDLGSKWYVSKYYRNGSLARNPSLFKGNILGALHAFRPLVEATGELHKRNRYHRDIKPENVYVDDDGKLILGDFGLIFFGDDERSRLSGTFENVGSRDWMPPWAQGMRVEDVRPSFDVFSLGKLLWSMISGRPFLRLWYYDRPQFNIESIFPKTKYGRLINELLKTCIVENEDDCLPDARALLARTDELIDTVEKIANGIFAGAVGRCLACGIGRYSQLLPGKADDLFHIEHQSFRIFACDRCGHTQLVHLEKAINR